VADPEGFEEFVAVRSGRLLRTAYLLTHDWARAEDLLQTALARAWLAWGRIHTHPDPYVRKIIVNTYASWWRRRWTHEDPTDRLPDVVALGGYGAVDERDALWRALRRLPKRQRAVIVLRYFEDLTEVEIADTLGCAVGTVKSQASKALARLRIDPALRTQTMLTLVPGPAEEVLP
jgi:RNA polymerase sigma-70 factor (sigma-E family)